MWEYDYQAGEVLLLNLNYRAFSRWWLAEREIVPAAICYYNNNNQYVFWERIINRPR